MGAKISLGMIVRNEGRTLRACLESVAPHVDEIVIGLAGESTDDTEQIAREFTENIIPIEWHEDFSEARNLVLDAVTGDYFLWLDGDDTLVGGQLLRSYIERFPNVSAFYTGYDYGRDEHGQNICYLIRERLVALYADEKDRGWRWINKVHEILNSSVPQTPMKIDDVVVMHHKPPGKHSPDRNLDILLKELKDSEPTPEPRLLMYVGNELASRGEQLAAFGYFNRFIKLSEWREEQYQAQHKIADGYRAMERWDKAIEADTAAVAILPEWPDAYFGLAETYYRMGNPKAAIEYSEVGSRKPVPQTTLIINPLDYSYNPAVILGLAHTANGDFDLALQMFKQAFEIKPEPTIAKQIQALTEELELHKVVDAFLALREHLGRNDQWLKVRNLYDSVPKAIEQHPQIQETWRRTLFQTAHVGDPKAMAAYYGNNDGWEPMPDSMIQDPRWPEYPRLKFALDVAKSIKAKTVLDLGSSDGFISLPMAKQGMNVVGYDLDPRCVDVANRRATEWELYAEYKVGDLNSIDEAPEGKYDLALLFEVIEHLVNPAATFEKVEQLAKHVAITTPYLAWEHGQIQTWDKLEPKGHIRIFDQFDLERLLTGRGQIMNIYRQPYSGSAWLFADYRPGVELKQKIQFFAAGTLEEWDPRMLARDGMGGSETAIVKLAEAFAETHDQPVVYTRTQEPGYYNGVCFRPIDHWRPEIKSDVFIAWRAPEAADFSVNTDLFVLWMHDVDAADRLTEERAKKIGKIVVLSEWHKKHMLETYAFLKPDKLVVIGNGVDANRFKEAIQRKPKKVVYPSSPDRGLDVILEKIWPKVISAVPDAELHTYYGWNNFDKLESIRPDLIPFRDHVQALVKSSTGVVAHGRIPQDRLAVELQEASIWLYPTYFHETYCITAVEAQLAGAIPITNHLAALEETVKSGIIIEGDVRDPGVQDRYVKAVVDTLQTPMDARSNLHRTVIENAQWSSWGAVASLWKQMVGEKSSG